jgi:hypothetical protein
MSKKEMEIMEQDLKQQRTSVSKSKKAAKKLLLDLGLITSKGNLTTVFKPVK